MNDQITAFLGRHLPVVSVDTKKKELVSAFKNEGANGGPPANRNPSTSMISLIPQCEKPFRAVQARR